MDCPPGCGNVSVSYRYDMNASLVKADQHVYLRLQGYIELLEAVKSQCARSTAGQNGNSEAALQVHHLSFKL